MKILFMAAEAAPMIKVGGLADVVGSLPPALLALGHDVRILMPNYGQIDHDRFPITALHDTWKVSWRGQELIVRVLEGRLPTAPVVVYYLDCPQMFGPESGLSGVYANSSDPSLMRRELERFVFFSVASVQAVDHMDWSPEVLHCHDWHTSLIPLIDTLNHPGSARPSLLTIHNLQSQGRWSGDEVLGWLGLTGAEAPILSLRDRDGNMNLLQIGIGQATAVNTVSPTYAQEILTTGYGEGLEVDLQKRGGVRGILNGIDIDHFNPSVDPALEVQYDRSSWPAGKKQNKSRIQKRLGLTLDEGRPLFAAIGRLVPQKGFELIAEAVPQIMAGGGQVALLGSGLPEIEKSLVDLAAAHPSMISVTLGFNADLAQQLYAAADFFLMPSQFEPCGLGQMIAMRYGTIPIVRDTGGLHDSVVDVMNQPDRGTGIVFGPFDQAGLTAAINTALQLYQQPDIVQVVARAMSQDFSWIASAQQYQNLYAQLKKNIPA